VHQAVITTSLQGINPVCATVAYIFYFLFILSLPAEVSPGADRRVNLQPAEHLLFCKQFSKMCPSAFRVSGPPGGGGCQIYSKTFLGQTAMCVQNFIKIHAGVWISISPLHTNRQTNICTPIYISIDKCSNIYENT